MAGSGGRAVLSSMLDRLLAGLMAGPNMNCRPHASRQRVDLTQLAKLNDATPESVLLGLLGEAQAAKVAAKVKPPRKAERKDDEPESPKERAYREQQGLLGKVRLITDEARTYENDTGVAALAVGFPLLSVPPPDGEGKRILAPVAFVPVSLAVKVAGTPGVELACKAEAGDRVRPNAALLAWIEQQTGHALPAENDDDSDPWGELKQLVQHVVTALGIADPFTSPPQDPAVAPATDSPVDGQSADDPERTAAEDGPAAEPLRSDVDEKPVTVPPAFALQPAPRGDEEADDDGPRIVVAAVLGLFPVPNQGLLRDTRAMMAEEPTGPVRTFLTAGVDFDAPPKVDAPAVATADAATAPAWLAAAADPCQARAVTLARDGAALVVHGPPGTGKSQTITNVIADHLCRGERVLLVCDKRTALDVVADRLGQLGLRGLCAIVHDPRRDQRDLYRTIKQQLDGLPEAKTKPQAAGQLERVDAELRKVHEELLAHHWSLMAATADGPSFSDLVGQWASAGGDPSIRLDEPAGVTVQAVAANRPALLDLFERARSVDLPRNPWAKCGGASLADYLARPMAAVRTTLARCVAAADAADATGDPAMPHLGEAVPLVEQGRARASWAKDVADLMPSVRAAGLTEWAAKDTTAVHRMAERVRAVLPAAANFAAHPPEEALKPAAPPAGEVATALAAVRAYLAVAGSWSAAFAFGVKAQAGRVLARFGLPLDRPSAERVATFLVSLQAGSTVSAVWAELGGMPAEPTEAQQLDGVTTAEQWLDRVQELTDTSALVNVGPAVARASADATAMDALLVALAHAPARAEAVTRLEDELGGADLFAPAWLGEVAAQQRRGLAAAGPLRTLADQVASLEGVLRVRDARAGLPVELLPAVDALVVQGVEPNAALAALDRAAVERAIGDRLRADPDLHRVDARRVESLFDQYRRLSQRRREHVRDQVEHVWVARQQGRFVAGTKLNAAGAGLKQRLVGKGRNANRLRQVFAGDGGDALMDLCPVWMASPETVAQVFPRRPVFDVVVFDEASQCRLEEALPVLVRGKRAVIAGDPHQLPPTRFFESGLVRSGDEDDEDETEQSLFEAHQASVEDLLSAALNLSVRQCYLDVHYRSRSPDLIAFSNEHFYDRRLVPIPTRQVAGEPAVLLHRVGGTYQKRCNPAEADAVVEIVRALLARPRPPSIGVACLNLVQRDLIVERLDQAAAADTIFAKRLTAARAGSGASDGLFVKNLENVQGDERDEIVISTTYGPRPDGRFHRRFGPLGMPGGGRRLNVLVTRARDRVHVVTSIPAEAYGSLPPVPEGQQASGAWLLFAYLKFAADVGNGHSALRDATGELRQTRHPSLLAEHVAASLASAHGVASTVNWGNDGFCIDVAPHGSDVGVLVDGCRYAGVGDPVDWDVFRTGVLAAQGWRLTRVWSPHLYRDPEGTLKAVVEAARSATTSPP